MAAAVIIPFEVTFSLKSLKDLPVLKFAKAILPWLLARLFLLLLFLQTQG